MDVCLAELCATSDTAKGLLVWWMAGSEAFGKFPEEWAGNGVGD